MSTSGLIGTDEAAALQGLKTHRRVVVDPGPRSRADAMSMRSSWPNPAR